ncbi:hypothetical protein K431DRAFT_61866 [Polychaeton citri CBS 116435]|uniref:Uncharacterized protein n=1 Tax=Polychaeton citri CBS 116435 TaxID=1314669 RepID=A0A9P4UQL3_9PEZI|nr:hypothetical protein K431DRAFT_61866 [Polychaeton citri CBS 116435]
MQKSFATSLRMSLRTFLCVGITMSSLVITGELWTTNMIAHTVSNLPPMGEIIISQTYSLTMDNKRHSTAASPLSSGAEVGITIGGVVFITVVAFLVWILARRRKARIRRPENEGLEEGESGRPNDNTPLTNVATSSHRAEPEAVGTVTDGDAFDQQRSREICFDVRTPGLDFTDVDLGRQATELDARSHETSPISETHGGQAVPDSIIEPNEGAHTVRLSDCSINKIADEDLRFAYATPIKPATVSKAAPQEPKEHARARDVIPSNEEATLPTMNMSPSSAYTDFGEPPSSILAGRRRIPPSLPQDYSLGSLQGVSEQKDDTPDTPSKLAGLHARPDGHGHPTNGS